MDAGELLSSLLRLVPNDRMSSIKLSEDFMIRLLIATLALVWGSIGLAHASSPSSLGDLAKRVNVLENQAARQGVLLPPLPILQEASRIQVAQSAADLAVRIDRLETQMRQYTGQMEEMTFRLRQLQEQLQRFQEDSEFRFQDLEKGKKPRKSSANQPTQPQHFEQLGAPPRTLGSLNQNQLPADNGAETTLMQGGQPGSGPIDLSSMLGGGAAPSPSTGNDNGGGAQLASLTGDPATDYDLAYSFVLQGNYQQAEQAFRQFVQTYAQHDLTPNAHYWLGESLYQQQNYRGAIEVFLDTYSQFPNAQKAPEVLLKTGMSLRKINERDAACATYEELLSKFPNASSGVRQKVMAEIKSAQC